MRGDPELYTLLDSLEIPFEYYAHPAAPTVEEAAQYWKDLDAFHCKNLFFRNHKGNRHYLVILEHRKVLEIKRLEQSLRQGKLSFASPKRLMKHLGLTPGSVTPFGLINDTEKHVHVFLDETLQQAHSISFHPCINTASLVVPYEGFIRFLSHCGNSWEYFKMYDEQN